MAKSSGYMLTSANVIMISGHGHGFSVQKNHALISVLAGQGRSIYAELQNRLNSQEDWPGWSPTAVPGIDTWRQWVWEWSAAPGSYLIEARATDQTGYTQTAVQAQPPPNGASG